MRLRTKVLFFICIAWAFFLIVSYAYAVNYSFKQAATYSFVSAILLFSLIYLVLIRRIEELSNMIAVINPKNIKSTRAEVSGSDEISLISAQINVILGLAQQANEQLNQAAKNHSTEIQKMKLELQNTHNKSDQSNKAPLKNLSNLAHYDEVTSLPNENFFNEILNKSINHSKRHNKLLALLLIEIDSFKNYIDKGLDASNQILKDVSMRLSQTLRTEDILAKYDEDGFIVLLNDIGKPKFASSVAEKLIQVCAQPIYIDNEEITVTVSIGICIYPNDGNSLEVLYENLEAATYKAQQNADNHYQFYTHELDIEARQYIKLESALRNAINNNQLMLYFQPKLHIKRGSITGVEVLLRWTHPTLGLINPGIFIPLAEEIGLMMPIGEFVLREACKINKHWQDEGYEHLTVAVNISPKQFYHPDFATVVRKIVEETGLAPAYLEIEITEKTVMDNIELATAILDDLKAIGIQISIDHFGMGYTSISHLKRFPISTIKIDQSFIRGVPNTPNDVAITNAFIALAHNLGLEVLAEGVETAEQLQYLATQGCDMVQGYYLSHPVPAQKIILQLKKLMDEVMIK